MILVMNLKKFLKEFIQNMQFENMRKILKFIRGEFTNKLHHELKYIADNDVVVKERFMRIFAETEMNAFIKKEFPLLEFSDSYFTATPVLKNGKGTDGVGFDFCDTFKKLFEEVYPEHII